MHVRRLGVAFAPGRPIVVDHCPGADPSASAAQVDHYFAEVLRRL